MSYIERPDYEKNPDSPKTFKRKDHRKEAKIKHALKHISLDNIDELDELEFD